MNDADLNRLSDDILKTIRNNRTDSKKSGTLKSLATKHHCEQADVIDAIKILKQTGYDIKSDEADSFVLLKPPDLLLSAEIANRLSTTLIGRKIHSYKTLQSTNITAAQMARSKATPPEGTIVVSEEQTKGRGRMGRKWESLSRKGIYLSIILYPKIKPTDAPGLSLVTALALAETLSDYGDLDVKIKWPNDCLVNGRKLAGILTELSAEMDVVNYLIVGVGINVNHRRSDFSGEMKTQATSLKAELKEEVNRVNLLQKFLVRFEKRYLKFVKTGLKAQRKKLIEYSNLIGENITLDMKGRIITGQVVDINDRGELVVDCGQPEGIKNFIAGEVTIVKK